jgi:5-methyltetrahydrofolate--homocysteine methyltransferase
LIDGKAEEAGELTQRALDQGVPPDKILDDGIKKGMNFVREEFRKGEFFIPKVFQAAKAMRAAMDILRPFLVSCGVRPIGKVALGTVKGYTHGFNKNLVSAMLEGAGFEVRDLGIDVPPARFVEAAEDEADIIAISVSRTTALIPMEATVKALEEAGLRDRVKAMIVGFPVSADYASRIGADGYSQSAAGAVDQAVELMETLQPGAL